MASNKRPDDRGSNQPSSNKKSGVDRVFASSTSLPSSKKARRVSPSPPSTVGPAMDLEVMCLICRYTVSEAFLTKCGHSFCFGCISKHLNSASKCPTCMQALTRDQIFPNFALDKLVRANSVGSTSLGALLAQDAHTLSSKEVDRMLAMLLRRKRSLNQDTTSLDQEVCMEFLQLLAEDKLSERSMIEQQIDTINTDLTTLKGKLKIDVDSKGSSKRQRLDESADTPLVPNAHAHTHGHEHHSTRPTSTEQLQSSSVHAFDTTNNNNSNNNNTKDSCNNHTSSDRSNNNNNNNNTTNNNNNNNTNDTYSRPHSNESDTDRDVSLRSENFRKDDGVLAELGAQRRASLDANGESETRTAKLIARRKRMRKHYKDLEHSYFESHGRLGLSGNNKALDHFEASLAKFTQFSQFRVFSQLNYGAVYHTSSIVSSIEFDRDQEYFATAGVTKEIKVYEYNSVVEQPKIETHTPIMKMTCQSKISCLSWNPYFKHQISSSDYEGIVSLWDAYVGIRIHKFEGHKKRTWSVDFAPTNPKLIASGSDDSLVKIWDINSEKAAYTIEKKANVCCVKFDPNNSHYIAFGSADHHIHYYDLRNLREDLFVFKGHAKAVSYVKFLNSDEIVSASTDSTLKLWSTKDKLCKRTYTGHTNEKNFVGLSTSQDFIACGSENNAVYCYYKSLSKPVICHKFGKEKHGDDDDPEDTANFVSSVCWKKNSNVLLAANSLGTISVMELI